MDEATRDYEQLELFERPPEELGDLIKRLKELKAEYRQAEAESKRIKALLDGLERDIIKAMHDNHLERAAAVGVVVEPLLKTYPHVEDWDKFENWLFENRYGHMIEHRVSVTGYRELLGLGRDVPGVVPFPKTVLSVRSIS